MDGGTGGLVPPHLRTGRRATADAAFFDAQGMAVVGTRIAMVEMVLAGQDYNYEPARSRWSPAVQRAARLLG